MYDKFLGLDEAKQNRVINAAIEEFIKGGYDKASMNDLVEAADISKGSLFYYFGNKKQLYLFLYSYSINKIDIGVRKHIDFTCGDVFERLKHYLDSSMLMLEESPLIFEFVKSFKTEKSKKVIGEIECEIAKKHDVSNELLLKELDFSYFKEDVDASKALYVIQTTISEILKSQMIEANEDPEKVMKSIEDYLSFFRTTFYK